MTITIKLDTNSTPKAVAEKVNVKKYDFQALVKSAAVNKATDNETQETMEDVFQQLEELIGLEDIKIMLFEIQAFTEIQKRRSQEHLTAEPTVLHAIFKGSPGTGKTTVARLLAKLYKEMGVLEKGHLVEVERADLVGEYIGHTAQKTRDTIKKALGGILFVDEAYSLSRGGEKDFGRESIDVLVKAMEDYKNEFIVILAGYSKEMDDFLQVNPGLNSRFPLHIDFPDYNLADLMKIARHMFTNRQYQMDKVADVQLEKGIGRIVAEYPETNGNARMVRNIIEASVRSQAVRIIQQDIITKNDLQLITETDINNALAKVNLKNVNVGKNTLFSAI